MGEIVKRHSVFLGEGCAMPAHFDPALQPCADSWMLLGEIGVGLSRDVAIHRALARALKGLKMRFNAGELESVHVSSYPVFHIAQVTLHPRHIPQLASLEMAVEDDARTVPAR